MTWRALKVAVALITLVLAQPAFAVSHGVQTFSILGQNLSTGQEEMPFLNVLKLAGGWYAEGCPGNCGQSDETLLYSSFLDANHYPTSLLVGGPCPGGLCPSRNFTQVSAYPLLSSGSGIATGNFPNGTYVLLYTGAQNTATAGTIVVAAFGGSIGFTCSGTGTGRCVATGFNSAGGARLRVTIIATDPTGIGNYINNVALIYAPDSTTSHVGVNEANFLAGNCMTQVNAACMNPLWLGAMRPFSTFRMMDWGNTLDNINQNWTDRSLVSWAFWNESEINFTTTGNPNGYPVEAQVAACNSLSASCWFNIPCMASAAYTQSQATLVNSILNSSLIAYAEFCNEIWNNGALGKNTGGTINPYMAAQGMTMFPDATGGTYDSGTTYALHQLALRNSDSEVFSSQSNGNTGNALTNPTFWHDNGYTCPSEGQPFSAFSYQFQYGVVQQVQYANIFSTTLGAGRVRRVLAGQNGYTDRNQNFIANWLPNNCGSTGLWASGTALSNSDIFVTAPYFGGVNALAWSADADGGLNKFFTEQNSGGILPTTTNSGNCGNGAGLTCGGPTAYTFTSGLTLPATPANGQCVGLTFNAASTGTGTTLQVDGGNVYPLADWHGNPINNGQSYVGTLFNGYSIPVCFTNKTAAGVVTPSWYIMYEYGYVGTSGNGWMAQAVDNWTADEAVAVSGASAKPLGAYESGQTYVPGSYQGSQDDTYTTWDTNAMLDPRMQAAYTAYYGKLKTVAPSGGVINIFADYGNWSQYGLWGNLQAITDTGSPRYWADVNAH